jgi:hypothetical protein
MGPWSFFQRGRFIFQGTLAEDIDYYNRTHEMFHILTSRTNRDNDDIEGFGFRWDSLLKYPDNFGGAAVDGFTAVTGSNTGLAAELFHSNRYSEY